MYLKRFYFENFQYKKDVSSMLQFSQIFFFLIFVDCCCSVLVTSSDDQWWSVLMRRINGNVRAITNHTTRILVFLYSFLLFWQQYTIEIFVLRNVLIFVAVETGNLKIKPENCFSLPIFKHQAFGKIIKTITEPNKRTGRRKSEWWTKTKEPLGFHFIFF